MDIRSKDEFIYFMQRATEDTSNDCYIELYNILLRWESAGFTFHNITPLGGPIFRSGPAEFFPL